MSIAQDIKQYKHLKARIRESYKTHKRVLTVPQNKLVVFLLWLSGHRCIKRCIGWEWY